MSAFDHGASAAGVFGPGVDGHRRLVVVEESDKADSAARQLDRLLQGEIGHTGDALPSPLAQEYPDIAFILGHSGGTPAGYVEAIEIAQVNDRYNETRIALTMIGVCRGCF